MTTFPTYSAGDLFELAERRSNEAHVATSGPATGVALPDWVAPCAVLSTERARRLGAQLLLACDEHDAVQESAFSVEGRSAMARAPRVEELRETLLARLHATVSDVHDRAALCGGVEELAELSMGGAS